MFFAGSYQRFTDTIIYVNNKGSVLERHIDLESHFSLLVKVKYEKYSRTRKRTHARMILRTHARTHARKHACTQTRSLARSLATQTCKHSGKVYSMKDWNVTPSNKNNKQRMPMTGFLPSVGVALRWAWIGSEVRWRMLAYAGVCWRVLTYADVC